MKKSIFCWAGGYCWFVSVQELYPAELVDGVDWFFGSLLPNEKFRKRRFEGIGKPLAKHDLRPTEMLQWIPALPLGGSREDSGPEIVGLREGHKLLAQTGELRLMRY